MGWDSPKCDTQHEEQYAEIEASGERIYIEIFSGHINGGSTILEMTFVQARNFRDQINTALFTKGED
jgi:predicted lipoprotein